MGKRKQVCSAAPAEKKHRLREEMASSSEEERLREQVALLHKENEELTEENDQLRRCLPGAHSYSVSAHDRRAQAEIVLGIVERCDAKISGTAKLCCEVHLLPDVPSEKLELYRSQIALVIADLRRIRKLVADAAALAVRVLESDDAMEFGAELDACVIKLVASEPEETIEELDERVRELNTRPLSTLDASMTPSPPLGSRDANVTAPYTAADIAVDGQHGSAVALPPSFPKDCWQDVLPHLSQHDLINRVSLLGKSFLAATNLLVSTFTAAAPNKMGYNVIEDNTNEQEKAKRREIVEVHVAAAIARFPRLSHFSLRGCGLATLPSSIVERCQVTTTTLDLSQNKGINLPTDIGLLRNLTEIDLFDCASPFSRRREEARETEQIALLPPSLFSHCTKLATVTLAYNFGVLLWRPNAIASLRHSLTVLNVASCGLTSLPNGIFECVLLRELHVSGNRFTNTIAANGIGGIDSRIGQLSMLEHLSAAVCSLTGLPDEIFTECSQIISLDLGSNDFVDLSHGAGSSSSIGDARFDKLEFLVELHLEKCQLGCIPTSVFDCTALRSLDVSGNPLRGHTRGGAATGAAAAADPEAGAGGDAGASVGARSNATFSHLVGRLKELRVLNVEECGLISLPLSLANCKHLEMLNASRNAFISLPLALPMLKQLQDLRLRGNVLRFFPTALGGLSMLEHLDLSDNYIEEETFAGHTDEEERGMEEDGVQALFAAQCAAMVECRSLHRHQQPFAPERTIIAPSRLHRQRTLSCELPHVDAGTAHDFGFPRLSRLNISLNPVVEILGATRGTFAGLMHDLERRGCTIDIAEYTSSGEE